MFFKMFGKYFPSIFFAAGEKWSQVKIEWEFNLYFGKSILYLSEIMLTVNSISIQNFTNSTPSKS